MSFTRLAGVAGIVFTALLLALNAMLGISGRPAGPAPSAEVGAWFAQHGLVVDLMTAGATVIWIAMTVFGVGILMATRSGDGSVDPWAVVGIVGVTMQHAIFSQVIGTDAALAASGDSLAEVVWHVHHAAFSLNNVSIALALGGFAVAAARTGLAPVWTRWVAAVGVAGLWINAMQSSLLLRGDGIAAFGLVGFLGWIVFAAAVAFRLLRVEAPATA